MTTPRLLGAAAVNLGALAFGAVTLGRFWLIGVFLAVALLLIGELGLRALVRSTLPALFRLGLGSTVGLISLPLVALVLHLTGVPIAGVSLTVGLAGWTAVLGAVALLRERSGRAEPDPRFLRTVVAVTIPGLVALVVGVAATFAYVRMPHPPRPGYTSVALGGWAADISRPITITAPGVEVPLRVSSAGAPGGVAPLAVRIGDLPAAPAVPVTIAADSTRSIEVYVPAPRNACVHRIEISLGAVGTVFYARGYGHGVAPC